MKTNKEIIIEELKDYLVRVNAYYEDERDGIDYPDKEFYESLKEDFATNLLSKLNTLDRDNIIEILSEDMVDLFDKTADQIMQLIPKQGEVIAEGEVKCIQEDEHGNPLEFCIDTNNTTDEGDLLLPWILEKYNGKEIIIKVVKR